MRQTKSVYLQSIKLLGSQIEQSYTEAKKIRLPDDYKQVNKIVTCGVGGSQLGVDLVRHLFSQKIKLPITQVRGYYLPKFVDKKTLVFLISYSGNTEEVITISKLITKFKIKAVIITSNGKLAKIAENKQIPFYIFEPINNPSGQPRIGIGYLIGSVIAILEKLKFIKLTQDQAVKMIKYTNKAFIKYQNFDQIKKYSQKLVNKIPVIVSSEFLQGNAHIISNQINESAKQLACYYAIPELNHHLLEGLTFPKSNRKTLHFLFFFSKSYNLRNQKRYLITQKILYRKKITYNNLEFKGDKTSQAMEMLVFGSLLSYQLAKINKVDPNKIPWVDYLKNKLKS
ncbi:SIS domain-containing protein [Patescibacteria group bacterium]|nr:SIS domain-containing protein [Patescibacteria group bacterium]